MKLFNEDVPVIVLWSDHVYSCKKCYNVKLESPATFAQTCAMGAPLLLEELAKRQAPVEKEKRKAIEQWAKDTGVFVTHRAKNTYTKYKS